MLFNTGKNEFYFKPFVLLMTFDLREDSPEKFHMVYVCVMTGNYPGQLYEDGGS